LSMNLPLGKEVLDKQMTPVSYNQENTQKCKHCILACEVFETTRNMAMAQIKNYIHPPFKWIW
jgi:hypothetical protein